MILEISITDIKDLEDLLKTNWLKIFDSSNLTTNDINRASDQIIDLCQMLDQAHPYIKHPRKFNIDITKFYCSLNRGDKQKFIECLTAYFSTYKPIIK